MLPVLDGTEGSAEEMPLEGLTVSGVSLLIAWQV